MDASAPSPRERRAAVYARVSTAEQVDGTSLMTQIERCRAYVESQGWVLADEFVDEGVSGAKASRPALGQLLRLVRSGGADTIVVAKLDRLGRSMRHLVVLLGELDDRGVRLVSVAEGFDSQTPSGRLQRNILGSFAEFEREQSRSGRGLQAGSELRFVTVSGPAGRRRTAGALFATAGTRRSN
jgi:DNA invertase Pin-like site-specific DNA recombinase